MNHPLLSVKNLSISFYKDEKWTPVVHDISYDLYPGKTLGIVGESGSGKSVSSLSLMGLLPAEISKIDTGNVHFRSGKKEIDLLNKDDLGIQLRGSEIAMIFQEPMTSLNPVYTCGDQICETLTRHKGFSNEESRKHTLEWFSQVELPSTERVFKAYPHELSGGQRQRVMIAMAMCCNPKLLIADEPTTALDVTVQKGVLDLIKKLQAEHQTAVIFISHDLGVVRALADDVLVMNKGRVVESGKVDGIFSNPTSSYTRGLISCKPESTLKTNKLLTVSQVLSGNSEPHLRSDLYSAKDEVLLKVVDLCKSYGGEYSWFQRNQTLTKAVDSVSFEIKKGETMGLVGESGCGKSTLSKMISGLLKPDSGQVIFKNENVENFTAAQWRNLRGKIQFIFQDPYSALNPRMSVRRVLTEVLQKHQPHLSNKESRAKSQSLLEEVGLPAGSMDKYPHQFSGGQRQRLVIARALAADPEFIIADESVSALDVSVQAQVLNLLNDLKAKYNLTFLFISHDLSVVNYMSDHLLVMKSGRIIESGLSDSIYKSPKEDYTKLLLDSVFV